MLHYFRNLAKSILDSALDRSAPARSAFVKVYSARQGYYLFNNDNGAKPIRKPKEYAEYPGLSLLGEFEQKPIEVKGGHRIAIWHRSVDDDEKPVYVVFHGRSGNWGDMGPPQLDDGKSDRRYRLKWLQAMAETGAEVIAVHLRGYGASKGLSDLKPTERGILKDIKGVANFLEQEGIDHRRVIVMGESLGGAVAAMLVEEMKSRGKPPAILGLIAAFSSLSECLEHMYPKLPHEEVRNRLQHRFETHRRVADLKDASTTLYLAHAQGDKVIPFQHQYILKEVAQKNDIRVETRTLEDGGLRDGIDYIHVGWNPAVIVQDVERIYAGKSLNGHDLPHPLKFSTNGHASSRTV